MKVIALSYNFSVFYEVFSMKRQDENAVSD